MLGVVKPIGELTSDSVEEHPWVKMPSLNLASLNRQNPTAINSGMQITQNMGGGCVAAIVDKYQNTPVLPKQGVFAALPHVKPNSKHKI